MNKRLTISLCAVVLLIGTAQYPRFRPPMPTEWNGLRSGMDEGEAIAIVGSWQVEDEAAKKYATHKRMFVPRGSVYWDLSLQFDATDKLVTADASFKPAWYDPFPLLPSQRHHSIFHAASK